MHALEHLRRDDRGPLIPLAHRDDSLLLDGHLGDVDFHTQVAASDHDCVGDRHDLLQSIERFTFLDFCDDASRRAARFQNSLKLTDVVGRANKTEAHEVDARTGRPYCVSPVVFADRWRAEPHAREVDALVAANGAALDHPQFNAPGAFRNDFHADGAVGQHDAVAQLQFVDERRVG